MTEKEKDEEREEILRQVNGDDFEKKFNDIAEAYQQGKKDAQKWIPVTDGLPKKPGVKSYEHVRCLCFVPRWGQVILEWNCEHNVWDDEDGDDCSSYNHDVTHYRILGPDPLPEKP